MLVVGILTVEAAIGEGSSLKDKRRVIRSLLDAIRHKFNVSAAEVGKLDTIRRSERAFCVVANEKSFANEVLDKVLWVVESDPRLDVIESDLEFV